MIWTLPNILTMTRILAAPLVGLMVALGGVEAQIWAFPIFVVAALTDFLDGWIARRFDLQSPLGQMLDPIADKAMVIIVLAVLTARPENQTLAFLLPAMAILLREVLISGLREYLGAVKLNVTMLAKWKTTVQLVAIGALLLTGPVMAYDTISSQEVAEQNAGWIVHGIGTLLLWLAAMLTVITGWDYFQKAMPHMKGTEG